MFDSAESCCAEMLSFLRFDECKRGGDNAQIPTRDIKREDDDAENMATGVTPRPRPRPLPPGREDNLQTRPAPENTQNMITGVTPYEVVEREYDCDYNIATSYTQSEQHISKPSDYNTYYQGPNPSSNIMVRQQTIPEGWYVDYSLSPPHGECVMSCETSQGSLCGGIADIWDDVYDTAEVCCEQKLWWRKLKQCVPGMTLRLFSEQWYVDYERGSGGQCAINLDGERPVEWEEYYPSAEMCCDEELWWMSKPQCVPGYGGRRKLQQNQMSNFIVHATDDVYIHRYDQNRNYNDRCSLQYSNGEVDSLIRFGLSEVNPQWLSQARLHLYPIEQCEGRMIVEVVGEDFSEESVTWRDAPYQVGPNSAQPEMVQQTPKMNTWHYVDVTNAVLWSAQVKRQPYVIFRLSSTNGDGCVLASHEYQGGRYSPGLELTGLGPGRVGTYPYRDGTYSSGNTYTHGDPYYQSGTRGRGGKSAKRAKAQHQYPYPRPSTAQQGNYNMMSGSKSAKKSKPSKSSDDSSSKSGGGWGAVRDGGGPRPTPPPTRKPIAQRRPPPSGGRGGWR